jgi:ABC-type nitrate/sulfonate/bicarbonate transport system substrate-binding protein
MVAVAGYGECGPGYIPTEAARREGFVEEHGYTWVAPGSEERLLAAIRAIIR